MSKETRSREEIFKEEQKKFYNDIAWQERNSFRFTVFMVVACTLLAIVGSILLLLK